MNILPAPEKLVLPPIPDGWHLLSLKVLSGARLAMVGADTDLHAAWQSDRAEKTVGEVFRLATRATGRMWVFQEGQLIEGISFPLLEPFPTLEQFPDGRWLIANTRSRGQGNGRIFGANGLEERRIELGDGIGHIKIDDQQRIWVGWFDEGVFGNDNWRLPGLKWAPSAYGIAAFDDRGTLLTHATLESIADCYALNVVADEAWACTYTDFPIWQMRDGRERTWSTNLRGTSAIAVKYPHVLAAGGYQVEANRIVLLRLEQHTARSLGEWRLPFEMGSTSEVRMIDGRDDELHIVEGQQWHRWRVTDFVRCLE
jgi:hypothetical protein